jgi:predicted permease
MLYELYQRPWLLALIIVTVVLWELIWKGVSLFISAKNNQKVWFVFLLVFNTIGLLPILYLIFARKESKNIGEQKEEKECVVDKK